MEDTIEVKNIIQYEALQLSRIDKSQQENSVSELEESDIGNWFKIRSDDRI